MLSRWRPVAQLAAHQVEGSVRRYCIGERPSTDWKAYPACARWCRPAGPASPASGRPADRLRPQPTSSISAQVRLTSSTRTHRRCRPAARSTAASTTRPVRRAVRRRAQVDVAVMAAQQFSGPIGWPVSRRRVADLALGIDEGEASVEGTSVRRAGTGWLVCFPRKTPGRQFSHWRKRPSKRPPRRVAHSAQPPATEVVLDMVVEVSGCSALADGRSGHREGHHGGAGRERREAHRAKQAAGPDSGSAMLSEMAKAPGHPDPP